METRAVEYKHCDLIETKGRIDSGTAPKFQEAVTSLTNAGKYRIVFDLGGVEFISSAGLRVLIAAQKECKRYNRGEVLLANVPPKIMSALELAGFHVLFKVFKDVVSAVGYF